MSKSNVWQQIKEKYPISSYLSDKGIEYQRKGRNLVLRCMIPGHDDSKPSFTVFDDSRYTCFACNSNPQNRDLAQGDIFDLASMIEGLPRGDVLFFLAGKAKVELDPADAENLKRRFEDTEKRRLLMNSFMVSLSNQPAWLGYLQNKRGLEMRTISYFGIGFDESSQHCSIPLRDQYSRLLAFTIHHPRADPKYRNPEDTEHYSKAKFLFNADSAKAGLRDHNVLYIVEGYMDTMSMWQHGYKTTVGYCGSLITKQQADAIKSLINSDTRIVLIPDADATGARAVQTNFETLRNVCSNPVFVGILHGKSGEEEFLAKDANDWFAVHKQTKIPEPVNYFEYIVAFYQAEYPDEYVQSQKIREAVKKANTFEKTKLIKRLAKKWDFTEQQVGAFIDAQVEESEVPYKDINYRIDELVDYVRNLDRLRMSFGFKELDELLRGLDPGEIAAVMGRANTCKTLMGTDMLDKMTELGKYGPTVFFSLEMPAVGITARMVTQFLKVRSGDDKISPSKIVEDKIKAEDSEMMEWLNRIRIAHHHLVVIDTPGLSVKDMDRLLDYVETNYFHEKVRMILVDHLQIMRSEGHNDYARTTAAAKDLRDMTKRRKIGTIVLVQTSRKGGSGGDPVSMDDGRDSGAIEEVMDFIFGIWRPELKIIQEMEKIRVAPVHPSQKTIRNDSGKPMKDSGGGQARETEAEAIQRARSEKARAIRMMSQMIIELRGLVYLQILKSRRENRNALLVFRIEGLNIEFVRHGADDLLENAAAQGGSGESSGVDPDDLEEPKGVRLDG